MSIRNQVHVAFEGTAESWWHRIDDVVITLMVLIATSCLVLETVPALSAWGPFFHLLQHVAGGVFVVEYGLRVWSCVEAPEFARPVLGRLRYALTPGAVIDVLSIVPFVFAMLFPGWALGSVLALLRVLRVLKLVRYVKAFQSFADVFRAKGAELLVAVSGAIVVLFFASTIVYVVEHPAQPDKFESIPSALWWGIVTMTTVGYGDLVPITAIGRLVGAIVALLGVGIVALPAGLLAAGFSDSIQREQRRHHLSEKDIEDLMEAVYRHGQQSDVSFRDLGVRQLVHGEKRRRARARREARERGGA